MITETLKFVKKNLDSPDVTRDCSHGKMEIVSFEDSCCTRVTLEPGWKWSEHVRPMAGTELCQAHHLQYAISGQLSVAMEDGSTQEIGPGDFANIPPGHDAWVIGSEPFVAVDFSPDMKQFAGESHDSHR